MEEDKRFRRGLLLGQDVEVQMSDREKTDEAHYASFHGHPNTKIIQITAQIDNAHHIVLGLGDNGLVYLWDAQLSGWRVYTPQSHTIPRRTGETS